MSSLSRQPPLDRATAAAVLAGIVPEFRVAAVLPRAGGEANRVYEVRGEPGTLPLIVKVYRERFPERWRSKVDKEAFVYALLARRGIERIPRVLHYEPVGTPLLPRAFAVMTALEGEPLSAVTGGRAGAAGPAGRVDRVLRVEPAYEEMGRLLAAVHRIRAARWGYVATGVVDAKPSNTAYMRDQFATKLGAFVALGGSPALAATIDRHVARHAEVFAGCRFPVLCHNDFHDGNVLVCEADSFWRVTGFVDVENSVAADPLLDVAKTDYYVLRHSPAGRRAFLRGYGPMPADGPARVALYRLHHALELWNWSASNGKRAALPAVEDDLDHALANDETLVSEF